MRAQAGAKVAAQGEQTHAKARHHTPRGSPRQPRHRVTAGPAAGAARAPSVATFPLPPPRKAPPSRVNLAVSARFITHVRGVGRNRTLIMLSGAALRTWERPRSSLRDAHARYTAPRASGSAVAVESAESISSPLSSSPLSSPAGSAWADDPDYPDSDDTAQTGEHRLQSIAEVTTRRPRAA